MKRDMDLLRSLLQHYVSSGGSNTFHHSDFPKIDSFEPKTVLAHRQLLFDAGYLVPSTDQYGSQKLPGTTFSFSVSNLGYDFYDATKDPTTWERTKAVVLRAGGWTLEVAFGVAKSLIQEQIDDLISGSVAA